MLQRLLCLGALLLGLAVVDGCAVTKGAGAAPGRCSNGACACTAYSPGQGPNCACGHPHPAQ